MRLMAKLIISLFFYSLGFSTLLFLGSVYVIATFLISPRYMQWYIRIGCRVVLMSFGQILLVRGKTPNPKQGPYLYLPNHESIFDMFMMGATVPEFFSIIAADYHFRIPLWRWIAKRYGAIPIKRSDLAQAIQSLDNAKQIISEFKRSLVIFFEGTRTKTGKLQPFKKGPFHLAKSARIDIVPCGIDGAFESQNRNSWFLKPGILIWHWGEVMPYGSDDALGYGHLTVEEIGEKVWHRVAKLTGEEKESEDTGKEV